MEGNKLDLLNKKEEKQPLASYKALPEADMEDQAVITSPKAIVKVKNLSVKDGADEKMLPDDESKFDSNNVIEPDNKIIIQENNGDAKIDIHGLKSSFTVMTKEELMKYANDPLWIRIRWVLFILFWLIWLGMLLGAISIIYAAPKCNPPPPRQWWEKGPLLEMKTDLTPEKLEQLKTGKFNGIIMEWPEDSYAEFNDSHNVIKLLKRSREIDFPIILDLEASLSNIWFENSENKNEFDDYYIWRESDKKDLNGDKAPPNNWISRKNESSWKYSPVRKAFYYAPEGWPQLNFRNQSVVQELVKVLKKFSEKGAKGFRIRDAHILLVDQHFADQAVDNSKEAKEKGFVLTDFGFYVHSKTENLLELGPLLKSLKNIVKNVTDNGPFMVKNVLENIDAYKSDAGSLVVDLPAQSNLFNKPVFEAEKVAHAFENIFKTQGIAWPLWTHKSDSLPVDVLDSITYLLPGVPLLEGNEIVNEELQAIRKSPSVMHGEFEYKAVANKTVLAFTRSAPGSPRLLVAVNPANETVVVDFEKDIQKISSEVTISFLSKNINSTEYAVGLKKDSNNILLPAKSSIVFTYSWIEEEDE